MTVNSSDLRTDQLAPHAIEAEEAVLGSILVSPDCLYDLLPFLKPDDFFIVRHQWIWEAMLRLQARREPIDYMTLVYELEQPGLLAEIGGAAYLLSLINKTPSALNAEGYGHIVERAAIRRRLIDAASTIARVAHSDETDIDTVIEKSEQSIFQVTHRRAHQNLHTMPDSASRVYDKTIDALRNGVSTGVKTYLADLDRLLVGLRKGNLILVGGRPGMGKSSLLESIAAANASEGIAVGLFNMEMTHDEITTRLIASESEIPFARIQAGKLFDPELPKFQAAVDCVSQWPLIIDDTPSLTPDDLRAKARQMVYEFGVELIMVDYIQLMHAGAGFRVKGGRTEEISYISRELKVIARELEVPIMAAAQLNRDVESRNDKRPQLSDLKESGSLEQDSDIVIFPYRDSYYNPDSEEGDVTELHVAKYRNGSTGMVKALFLPKKTRFVDLYEESRRKVFGQASGEREVELGTK